MADDSDVRRGLLRALQLSRVSFVHVRDAYDSPKQYLSDVTRNILAEVAGVFKQSNRSAGIRLNYEFSKVVTGYGKESHKEYFWIARDRVPRSLKGSIVEDVVTGDVFWISAWEEIWEDLCRVEGFDLHGNYKSLHRPGRCVRVVMYGGDHSSRLLGLRHQLEIIHGPPGTGKSTTILGLLKSRVPSSRIACVTCVTNQAVDAICSKLCHSFAARPFVVLGSKDNLGVVSQQYLLDHIAAQQESVVQARQAMDAIMAIDDQKDALQQKSWRQKVNLFRRKYDEEVEKAEQDILARSRILVSTIASLYRIANRVDLGGVALGEPIHTVVIDEAGATPESYIPLALQFNVENLVLCGDHKQLPPLVVAQDIKDVEEKHVNRSLMERALVTMPLAWVHHLSEQYRMPPTLCNLVSSLFYDGMLTTNAAGVDAMSKPLRWLAVEQPETRVGTSRVNLAEATVCIQWLRERFPLAKDRGETLRCIAFYKLRCELIRECLLFEEQHLAECVISVDAAQGSEWHDVLLSTVRSNEAGDIGFCADSRRLCVALSRSKSRLTVVGNPKCMCKGQWQAVLEASELESGCLDPETASQVDRKFDTFKEDSAKPCRYFLLGNCSNQECKFVHDSKLDEEAISALRRTAKPCVFHLQGTCTKGARCIFSHDASLAHEQSNCDKSLKPCLFYSQGKCSKGEDCNFSHDFTPGDKKITAAIRKSAEPCQFHAQGRCSNGDGCTYSHEFRPGDRKVAAQLRQTAPICEFFARGRCTNGSACTFSHDPGSIQTSRGLASKEQTKGRGKGKAIGKASRT